MEKVELAGVPETMLQTLHARAQYTLSHPQLLSDPQAVELVSRIDYDFTAARSDQLMSFGTAARTLLFDDLVRDFIARHPGCTVVNVGCGLDTRFHRVDDGQVRWYDLDLPSVIELRERLLGRIERVQMIAASAMDPGWPQQVEATGEVLVIVEGLTMYLTVQDLRSLMGLIHDAFPGATALVEVMTDPNALSLPPEIRSGQVIGFATAMSKIVLNRGAGEVVSMATSNMRNIPRL